MVITRDDDGRVTNVMVGDIAGKDASYPLLTTIVPFIGSDQFRNAWNAAITSRRAEARGRVSEALREAFPGAVRIVMEEFTAFLAPIRYGALLGKAALTVAVYQFLGTLGIETPLEAAKAAFNEQMTEFLASLKHLNRLIVPSPTSKETYLIMSYHGEEGLPDVPSAAEEILAFANRSEVRHALIVSAPRHQADAFIEALDQFLRAKTGCALSTFKNSIILVVDSDRNVFQKVHTLVSKWNIPSAFVAQLSEDRFHNLASQRLLLLVAVDQPANHTIALVASVELLKEIPPDSLLTCGVRNVKDLITSE